MLLTVLDLYDNFNQPLKGLIAWKLGLYIWDNIDSLN